MKLLLTTSAEPLQAPFDTSEKKPPLGIGFLISTCREAGHDVHFIDNYLEPTNFIEDGYLQKNNIDYVGIYANTICFNDTLRMLNAIQALRVRGKWNGKIIVGGPHTSVAVDTIPFFVDFIVQGEGEKALINILSERELPRIIRGERIDNLDQLPFLPWDIFTKLPYSFEAGWTDVEPVFTLNTSRGCPFACSFCSVNLIWGKKYTCMSTKRILDELNILINQYGAKGIYFREDNFTVNKKRTINICEELINRKIDIHWACESRVDTLCDENLVIMMAKSGCKWVYLGIESGSEEVLNRLNKNISVDQIREGIGLCHKYDIKVYASLMVGLPDEKYEDYLITEKLMEELKPIDIAFLVYIGLPGSQIYDYCYENNIYEYIDSTGIMYLPGYNIRAKYFYGEWENFIPFKYNFKNKINYDDILEKALPRLSLRSDKQYISELINAQKWLTGQLDNHQKALEVLRQENIKLSEKFSEISLRRIASLIYKKIIKQ